MKYQPGDKILVLHSKEEGEVVEIINEQMVMIEVDNIRFPVYNDQIDFPYYTRFTKKKDPFKPPKTYIDDLKRESSTTKYKVGTGVWLTFLPVFDKDVFDDDIVESFKIYLVNQTEVEYTFQYTQTYLTKEGFELKNEIRPFSDFYIHDIEFDDMNDVPKFQIEFSLKNPDKKKAEYFEASVKIKAKQLFQRIEEMRQKNEPTFSYNLFENYPDRIVEDRPDFNKLSGAGYRIYDVGKASLNLEPARSVIDLHIEKLSDSWKHLTNFEILTIQLKAFEKYYDLAVGHRQPSLIVIHGIGKGKLKDELHELLKMKKEVKTFVNQYNPNYGYGATEIYFQY